LGKSGTALHFGSIWRRFNSNSCLSF
jgi:esterase/lipase superfamily enzyme